MGIGAAHWWDRLSERFFGASVELISPLPAAECGRRLQAAVDAPTTLFGKRPVVGRVTGTRLRAKKRVAIRNSFQTRVSAELFERDGQTNVRCRFSMDPSVMVFLAVVIGIVVAAAVPTSLVYLAALVVSTVDTIEAPPLALAIPLLFLAALLVMVGIGRGLASGEREFLIAFIADVVGSVPAGVPGTPPMPGKPEIARYFIKRNHPGDPHVAVYRIYRPPQGHYDGAVWLDGRWLQSDDVYRCFRTGFDADVDEVDQAEALDAIRTLKR